MSKPAAPLSLPEVLQVHQYQYDGSHRNPNECALCAMTTLTTLAARRSGQPGFSLAAVQLGRFLDRIPFRFPRFPAWFPGPGGATHPLAALWGLRAYGRSLRKQGLRASRGSQCCAPGNPPRLCALPWRQASRR
ncbi:MAG TPA: hypothetical protein PLC52_10285 [Anaerolineales bacterium]|nr:hypothetical protein [Anaerolineales bacterium]HRQ93239.1 hypothetical protein [Anaerolineales bacterium]